MRRSRSAWATQGAPRARMRGERKSSWRSACVVAPPSSWLTTNVSPMTRSTQIGARAAKAARIVSASSVRLSAPPSRMNLKRQ